ncbi:glycerophosphodiester phosphodiesterase [Calditerricola satsumensis]|uniref:Glycerophosphoryl diester phosphodiesterase n=1 Tax=Calditerricola satsumensis TaxID=373054 RepID=A0A8J3BCT6_9BACI|nr:glycerophosphodiester phosphodiesterase family protein [Calditerricola satsumensis]GGJ97605.1 glycerophosphoryl diester phosphodiesterase [Calditerricola satsumensis]
MNPCVAHRGWSGAAPENTLAAIRLAAEDPEIEMVEIDVQLSRDGVPVVFHDFTLERTTNGSGRVCDRTVRELQALDAGSWFDRRFAGETIPTLREVLECVRGQCKLNIELKAAGFSPPGLAEKVVSLVRECGMRDQVIVTSFHHPTAKRVKELDRGLTVGIIVYGCPTLLREQMRDVRADVLSIAYPYLSKELVQEMLAEGKELIAWTVDDPEEMRAIMRLHPSIKICTNRPDVWKRVKGGERR